jgi:ATP-binding cassette, subfamily G (WHITE), member 2, PDR
MVWNESEERRQVKVTLAEMKATLSQKETIQDETALDSFAATFPVQLWTVLIRVFEQYWRTPSYLYSKTLLCTAVVGHSGSL